MGRSSRRKQVRLAEKLQAIRSALGLSQNEMLRRLELTEDLGRNNISSYEIGEREPPLYVLLRYARAAGICMDMLVDDEQNLPDKIPGEARHQGVSHN